MKYLEFKPTELLSKYIQMIWILESESKNDVFEKQKILPDGIVEIVFHFKEPFITTSSNGEKLKQPKGFVISQMRKFIEIESDGEIGFVSVRFYPWGAYHFFSKPIQSFLDTTLDLKEIWEDSYQSILQELKSVNNNKRIELIQNYLTTKLQENQKQINDVDSAIKLIRNEKGQDTIEQICKKTNLSYKQLERKFLSSIGTTPKVFSQTTRLLHLCHHLAEYENKTMTELAYKLGYYDQAHFIKNFKKFTGFTPKEYYDCNNICFAEF